MRYALTALVAILLVASCTAGAGRGTSSEEGRALYFDVLDDSTVAVINPYSSKRDTLTGGSMSRFVLMSGSYLAALDRIGCSEMVLGMSGKKYVSNPYVKEHAIEVGYDSNLNYEAVVKLAPDLLVGYSLSPEEPAYCSILRSLGVKTLIISDQLEEDPLARAEYVRLFGALTGRLHEADSAYGAIASRYNELKKMVKDAAPVKVLINVPYGDAWYIPGENSYMSQLIRDAGGMILGSREGRSESSLISVEQAYALSMEADCWLNVGWAYTLGQLRGLNPLFGDFPVIHKKVYNNTLRTTPEGGNDFWESGSSRPDLILEDLIRIFHPSVLPEGSLKYYIEVKD